MNHNLNTTQEEKKHFLTFHIPFKNQLKTLQLSRRAAAICAAAMIMVSGTAYAAVLDEDVASAEAAGLDEAITEASDFFAGVSDQMIYAAYNSNTPSGWPLESRLVSTEFNPTGDRSISDGRRHKGMDISTRSQIIPIHATAAGTVTTATYHSGFGNYVVIDHHNGYTTLYAHCSELTVQVGDTVAKGDIIGMTGNTGMSSGIHLHYEIQLNGVYQNPRDYLQ